MPKKTTRDELEPALAPLERLLVDIPTAAKMLNTTVFGVREAIRKDLIKFVPMGHQQLMSPAALREYIETRSTTYSEQYPRRAADQRERTKRDPPT
jgi:hypothetical protein